MTSEQFEAVIVGAGFGGIGAAIQLKRMGYQNFVILDRRSGKLSLSAGPVSLVGPGAGRFG